MVSCAVGGVWPRARRKAEMPKYRGPELCGRCGKNAETLKHRVWECECNTGSSAYTESEELVSQAL
eukprot:1468853-Pyramimonas_sp.AAC.1